MKFLLFNAAVIAALIYLFGADRSDLDAASGHLRASAERLGEVARDKVDAALDGPPGTPSLDGDPAHGYADDPGTPPAEVRAPEPLLEDTAQETMAAAKAESAEPAPEARLPASTAEKAGTASAESPEEFPEKATTDSLPALRDPAVAKRRAEVLGGVAPAEGTASVALAEGERLMSPEQRVRELHALAEEMELLFVDKMAR
ncbi:MAG: hypothetical protein QNJ30_06600 [Kiloniellales bacterium]|nr:hypothetical protein [Kiloniellales bacterium]